MEKINFYDTLNDTELWFKYHNNFLKLFNKTAALQLSIKDDKPMQGHSGVMKFGAHAFTVNQDDKPNENIISRISIEQILKADTELYSDTDIFSMMKFQLPYTDIPSTTTVEKLIASKIAQDLENQEKEDSKFDNFKVNFEQFEVNIRVYKNGKVDGWFEHDEYGDEVGGQLMFEETEDGRIGLIDYDGVSVLPLPVGKVIAQMGYVIDLDHYCS